MTDRHTSADNAGVHDAQDVRQGEIILRRRWQRLVFLSGLAGILALFLIGTLVAVIG